MGVNPLNLFGLTGLLAKKFQKKDPVTAPAPVDPGVVDPKQEVKLGGAIPPPVSTPLATSTAIGAATVAQQKAKKRAAAGNVLVAPSMTKAPSATLTPKTLVGKIGY